MDVAKGDVVEVVSNRVGQPNQRGTVMRVVQRDPVRIEVRWEDGHTSLFMPAAGNTRVVEGRR
jgi:multidrug resistance efflux pump